MHCPKCKDWMEYHNGAFECEACDHIEYPYDALRADEEETYETDPNILHLKD